MQCFNTECDYFDETDPAGDNCHLIQNPEPSDCEAIVSQKATVATSPSEALGSTTKCDKDSCKYYSFWNSVTCLFAEGVEFMTREQLYQAIKKEWRSHMMR